MGNEQSLNKIDNNVPYQLEWTTPLNVYRKFTFDFLQFFLLRVTYLEFRNIHGSFKNIPQFFCWRTFICNRFKSYVQIVIWRAQRRKMHTVYIIVDIIPFWEEILEDSSSTVFCVLSPPWVRFREETESVCSMASKTWVREKLSDWPEDLQWREVESLVQVSQQELSTSQIAHLKSSYSKLFASCDVWLSLRLKQCKLSLIGQAILIQTNFIVKKVTFFD